MKFNIWFSFEEEIKKDGETLETKSTRKNMKGIDKENLAKTVNDLINSIPENATGVYLELSKRYEDSEIIAAVDSY